MRRAVPLLVATFLGLVLLLQFHTTTGQTVATAPTGSDAAPSRPTTPPAGAPPSSSSSSPATPTTGASGPTRTVDGAVETNRYGDVQVRVTIQGSRITDVEALQLPTDRERSAEISDFAGPRLRQEALQAQSASIDTVSGATYTSTGYRQSLQSALDKAGIH